MDRHVHRFHDAAAGAKETEESGARIGRTRWWFNLMVRTNLVKTGSQALSGASGTRRFCKWLTPRRAEFPS
ncbi:hypothetical protein E4U54_002256 [Claviceps lovelessii]|nr:hypothetical protein E4U54_002256 [Claviceps lovelessii]